MQKIKLGLKIFVSLIFLFLPMGIMLTYSKYDSQIYNIPRASLGVMDFKDCRDYNKNINLPIVGEIEFYYNRWIITDQDTNPMDSYIMAPSKWSNRTNNEIIYPRRGYASYKITLINLEPNQTLKVTCASLTLSVNLFLNGTHAGYCGFPSKTTTDKVADLNESASDYIIIPEDGKVEVVLETGLSEYGGLVAMPYLALEEHNSTYMSFINFLPATTFGLLVFSIVISLFISFSLKRGEGRYYPFLTFLCITLHFVFSYDILLRTRGFNLYAKDMIFQGLSFLSLAIFTSCQIFYLIKNKDVKIPKGYALASLVCLLLLSAFYFPLLATVGILYLWMLFYIINLPVIVVCFIRLFKHTKNEFFIYIYFLMIGVSIIEMLDYLDLITLTTYGHTSVYMLFLILMTFVFYGHRLIHLNTMEKRNKDMEIEALKLKQDILLNQIKPHFVYNALTTIQGLYHKDVLEGDKGIVLFSKYLRTNVDAIEAGLIPFNDELDNIINYIDLVNLSVVPPFNLEVDIAYEDFMLPVLSLQPIIENAIKYSQVNVKENGYIKIKTYQKDNLVWIEISNNGVPFDIQKIKNTSKGLKNIQQRLESILKAKLIIESDEEETKVIICFQQGLN